MDVFQVWHVRHAEFIDGRPTKHFDEDNELIIEEEEGDNLKVLGVYSSESDAHNRIDLARTEPGFAPEPECFYVAKYTLGEHLWVDGFVSLDRASDMDERQEP